MKKSKSKQNKGTQMWYRRWIKRKAALVVILVFAIVGVLLIWRSFAANPNLTGDINNDNVVNLTDLSVLLSNFGGPSTTVDLNGDNIVNLADLSQLLSNFGRTYTPPGPNPNPPNPNPPGPNPNPGNTICPYAGSGEAIPTQDVGKFKLTFADDFCVDSATGSWRVDGTLPTNDPEAKKIVYTGRGPTGATKWVTYPKSYLDTYDDRPYRADKVLSTHDGGMDFHLHKVDGMPAGANSSPVITGTSQYITYGRFSARFKVFATTGDMREYYAAWLLWPDDETGGGQGCEAESDFPEGNLNGAVQGFHHNGCNPNRQDHIDGGGARMTDWHTYTQDWEPGKRTYYVDGQKVGESTTGVYDKPERWQLQNETKGDGNSEGHMIVDWVAVWQYQP